MCVCVCVCVCMINVCTKACVFMCDYYTSPEICLYKSNTLD